MSNEPQPVRRTVRRSPRRTTRRARPRRPVLVAHRTRDPGHVVMREQAAERRDDTAAAPLRDALARPRHALRHRRTIDDDEKLTPALSRSDNDQAGWRNRFTNRSREPRTPGWECDLELVGDRADDRDAEASLGELLALERRRPLADRTPSRRRPPRSASASSLSSYAMETKPSPARVRVPDRVRDGLRQRELEVGQKFVGQPRRCRRVR